MARRSMKICFLCEQAENGEHKAIGKYFLVKRHGQAFSGQIPVCENCAPGLENAGFQIEYYNPKKDIDVIDCKSHEWFKTNLVTKSDGHDLWKCEKCGAKQKWLIGRPPA